MADLISFKDFLIVSNVDIYMCFPSDEQQGLLFTHLTFYVCEEYLRFGISSGILQTVRLTG